MGFDSAIKNRLVLPRGFSLKFFHSASHPPIAIAKGKFAAVEERTSAATASGSARQPSWGYELVYETTVPEARWVKAAAPASLSFLRHLSRIHSERQITRSEAVVVVLPEPWWRTCFGYQHSEPAA